IPIKNLILMTAIFIALLAVTGLVFIKATSQPAFCVTCHYMKPYFASWKTSTHQDVHCTECHFPPGVKGTVKGKFTAMSMLVNYWTGVYKKSKPWAEISDDSCLREGCHETRLLQGQVPYKEGIVFDHTHHLTEDRRGKTLRCTSCHSQIVQGSHMNVTEETCFLCHFKDQQNGTRMTNCTRCHEAPLANDSTTVLFDHTEMVARDVECRLCHGDMSHGSGDVPRNRCSYCHAEAGKLEQYSQTTTIHQIHITDHKVECNHCHNTITHQSVARRGDIKPECQACHIDRHLDQYQMFSGQGAEGIDPMPSSMFHAGLGCKACHVILPNDWKQHPENATSVAGSASCSPCHAGEYYKLYTNAKPHLARRIKSTKDRIKTLSATPQGVKADSILGVASRNMAFLEQAIPIHNMSYTDRVLNETDRSLSLLSGVKPLPRVLPDTTSARCLNCHYGNDEVSVPYQNHIFSHRNHVYNAGVGCNTCHIEEKPHHGQLKGGDFCMECHHSSAAVSCEPCHSNQRSLIHGDGTFTDFDPDIMYEAGITCRDCHEVVGKSVAHPGEEVCESCHEPGYWEDQVERQAEFENQIRLLRAELDEIIDQKVRKEGYRLIRALETDGTKGAHNAIAAMDALDALHELVRTAKAQQ
ncbi:NapC/NirT family cytochrome c, partial [bacterium]|nr:NapC/NirT family cytochrome c [bacterium]